MDKISRSERDELIFQNGHSARGWREILEMRRAAGRHVARMNGVRFGRKPVSQETIDRIIMLHLCGYTHKSIGIQTKLNRNTVGKILKREREKQNESVTRE